MILNKHVTGVYGIFNKKTKKWYVGSSAKCIRGRLESHKYSLNKNSHHSRHLQNAWNKYGETSFSFLILKRCKSSLCVRYEQSYIDKYDAANPDRGYNICPLSRSALGVRRTQETKDKISVLAKNRPAELKEKLAAYTRTPEARKRSSDLHKGKVLSQETRIKISNSVRAQLPVYYAKMMKAKEYLIGVPVPPERGLKISIANTGKKRSEEHKANYRRYALNRTPEHQAKITAGIRAANERKKRNPQ